MKNIFNKFAFFIALSFVFISCGNLTTSENDDSIPQGKGKITISTDLQNGRSVLPTEIKEDTTGLKWELVGTKDGTQQIIKSWTDDNSGTAYKSMTSDSGIVIDIGTWDFTLTASLTASQNNATEELNVLQAQCNSVQIDAGNNALNFVMQEATEKAASGSIEFTLNFPKDVVGNVVATLYKYDNDNNVVDTNQQLAINNSSNDFDSVKYSYPDATGTTSSPLSAGYYILKIELQQKGDATTPAVEYINTYSCLIRVAPGLTSKGVYTLDKLAQLYTITYKLNEGTFDSTTSAVPTSYNAYTSFELPTPTREGYEFAGWYTDENLQKPVQLDESNKYKITQDTTLYAKWKISWDGLKQQIENNSGISEFVITEDLTATSTITVSKPFKITSDKNVTITRGNSIDGAIFKDAFFKVESAGNLELEGTENITITLDGGNANESPILATAPLITSSGNLTLTNCILQNNTNNTDYDGGGGVYISGESSIFTMTGGEISGNSAYYGGGVYISGESSIFTMTGGEISGNSAEYGGGVATIGKFSMSGGTISGNKVTNNGNGSGVYVAYYSGTIEYVGTFEMSGGAYVNDNDVYLANGTSVTVAGNLTSTDTVAATITPNEYSATRQVITVPESADGATSSVTLSEQVGKFAVTPQTAADGATINWTINANGFLSKEAVYYVGDNESDNPQGTETSPFTTLQAAVDEVNNINDGTSSYTIYVMSNITWEEDSYVAISSDFINITPTNSLNLKICGYNSTGVTIDANQKGRVMYISPNANVTLQNLILTGGYLNGNNGAGLYILNNNTAAVTIKNCEIKENTIDNGCGAGIYVVYNSGNLKLTIENSKIFSNTINHNNGIGTYSGAGIAIENVEANITIKDSEITGNKINQDGIQNSTPRDRGVGLWLGNSAETTISGSTISNNIIENAALNNENAGGGVYVSGGTFTMSGDAYVDSNNDVYLAGEATVTVAGYLTSDKTPVATITPATYSVGTKVLTAEDPNLLAQCVSKFALSDETYSIDNGGYIVVSNQSSATSLIQTYLDENLKKTNISGDFYYELLAGEYCVSENLKLKYPIQINAASGGEVKLYADGDYTISCAENFDNSANSAMIALPMSTGTLILGGGNGTLTIDGSGISSLMYLILSQSTLILKDNCTITNGNVTYTAIYVSAGTFTMTGGTITNIHSTKAASEGYGAGIHVLDSNTVVTVSGGSVCNNYNNETNCGASIYNSGGNVTVLGQSVVSGSQFTQNIVSGSVSNAILISSWDELVSNIDLLEDENVTTEFLITDDLVATVTISTLTPVKITSSKAIAITRDENFTGTFFEVASSFEITGSENATVTFDGGSSRGIIAQDSVIKTSANLFLTYCNFYNNTNEASLGGGGGCFC